ncbi:reactive mitochondrial oxygen species modulator 1 domain-containing protein [Ditylenchus destructor]|uniref:Reactive oxygen species modulator 1 n=1 Tax=Ditylenchus destructor TaxID=166010 RepID=A0AAD4R526_9BILA|nr:reactive mitochondrial oxygen species modulator 1 domain-containing protein [Ditylenchus destructor]
MPVGVPQGYQAVHGGQGPTCFQKLKMGFMMGAMIGGTMGVILGTGTGFRVGLRGKEMLVHIGKYAASSGGSFGVFMTVAQGLRC